MVNNSNVIRKGTKSVIKRELYMSRIRPFIGSDLIKVMTGIRRCGKSVMLELIKQELMDSGVSPIQFISINFEDMSYSHLQTAESLHDEITKRAAEMQGKVYLFFDEIQEVRDWEKCINSFRVSLDCDIYITGSNAKMLSGEINTTLGGRFLTSEIYPYSFKEYLDAHRIPWDEKVNSLFESDKNAIKARFPNSGERRSDGYLLAAEGGTNKRLYFREGDIPKISNTKDLQIYLFAGGEKIIDQMSQ